MREPAQPAQPPLPKPKGVGWNGHFDVGLFIWCSRCAVLRRFEDVKGKGVKPIRAIDMDERRCVTKEFQGYRPCECGETKFCVRLQW